MLIVEAKFCLACGVEIHGRADKKYCDDNCRNDYNNDRKKRANYGFIKNVNNALVINRGIMLSLLDAGNYKTTTDILKQMGFNFKYHTHSYQSKTGKTYRYCYDYGYLQLEADKVLIVKHDA